MLCGVVMVAVIAPAGGVVEGRCPPRSLCVEGWGFVVGVLGLGVAGAGESI